MTPLHLAYFFGNYDDIQKLRELGADEDALDDYKRKPADLAFFAGHLDTDDIDPEQYM